MHLVIPIRPAVFENESRIAVFIPNEENIKNLIRQVPKCRWSPLHKCWHFLKTQENWTIFITHFKDCNLNIQKDLEPLSIPASEIWEKPKLELKSDYLNRFILPSEATIQNALNQEKEKIKTIFVHKTPYQLEKVVFDEQKFLGIPIASTDQVGREIIKKIEGRKWHPQEFMWIVPYNQLTYDKLKSGFEGKLVPPTTKEFRLIKPPVHEPKLTLKPKHLPKTLEPAEIVRLFAQVSNIKHKCILMLMYGSGLRVGEVVRLKWKDLDFLEKTVFIHNGKNYKDRYTILSEKTIAYLQKYKLEYESNDWVFESPDGGHYSERSVQQFFGDALAKARIDKQVSTHSLRHAFATQLLKANTDLDFVRKVMGHASIKTTQIYLHVLKTDLTKTRSPLDDLNI